VKAKRALAALLRIGWYIKRQGGTSHRMHRTVVLIGDTMAKSNGGPQSEAGGEKR